MCLHIEKSHIKLLKYKVLRSVKDLQVSANALSDPFLGHPRYARDIVVYRDFPKRHGNLIQDAVAIALASHPGGISALRKRFPVLSGITVEVDNLFVASNGQIFLFETKRQFDTVRDKGEPISKLIEVEKILIAEIKKVIGNSARPSITCAYFDYFSDRNPPRIESLDIRRGKTFRKEDVRVFSRAEMNALIGPCFGAWLKEFDAYVGHNLEQNLLDEGEVAAVREMPLSDVFGSDDSEVPVILGDVSCYSPPPGQLLFRTEV